VFDTFRFILPGLGITIAVTLIALGLGLMLGIVMGICRAFGGTPLAQVAAAYSIVVRSLPVVVIIFILFFVISELVDLSPFFSGAIACRVIEALSLEASPDTLLVFGRHMHPGESPVLMPSGSWQTPFGPLPVDEALVAELMPNFHFKLESPRHFEPDNTIELQLPFIKYFFPDASIVAVGVPPAESAMAIGRSAVEIGQRQHKRLAVIGSTDLTHHGANYGYSPHGHGPRAVARVREKNDGPMVTAMEEMDASRVLTQARDQHSACCAGAVAAALTAGHCLGAVRGETLAYTTSYAKSPGDSFVGYAGILF